jgi:hypothetical protein
MNFFHHWFVLFENCVSVFTCVKFLSNKTINLEFTFKNLLYYEILTKSK